MGLIGVDDIHSSVVEQCGAENGVGPTQCICHDCATVSLNDSILHCRLLILTSRRCGFRPKPRKRRLQASLTRSSTYNGRSERRRRRRGSWPMCKARNPWLDRHATGSRSADSTELPVQWRIYGVEQATPDTTRRTRPVLRPLAPYHWPLSSPSLRARPRPALYAAPQKRPPCTAKTKPAQTSSTSRFYTFLTPSRSQVPPICLCRGSYSGVLRGLRLVPSRRPGKSHGVTASGGRSGRTVAKSWARLDVYEFLEDDRGSRVP